MLTAYFADEENPQTTLVPDGCISVVSGMCTYRVIRNYKWKTKLNFMTDNLTSRVTNTRGCIQVCPSLPDICRNIRACMEVRPTSILIWILIINCCTTHYFCLSSFHGIRSQTPSLWLWMTRNTDCNWTWSCLKPLKQLRRQLTRHDFAPHVGACLRRSKYCML